MLQERLSIQRSITKTCRAGSSAVCWWWNKYPKITNHGPLDTFIIQHFSFIIIISAPTSSDALAVVSIWDGNEAWSLWRWIISSFPFINVSVFMSVVAGKVLHREEQNCFNNFLILTNFKMIFRYFPSSHWTEIKYFRSALVFHEDKLWLNRFPMLRWTG